MDTTDLTIILDNTLNWNVGVRTRVRNFLRKKGMLPDQPNFTKSLTLEQGREIGEEIELYIRDCANNAHRMKENSNTLAAEIFNLALSRFDWPEIGLTYWSTVLEEDFGIFDARAGEAA